MQSATAAPTGFFGSPTTNSVPSSPFVTNNATLQRQYQRQRGGYGGAAKDRPNWGWLIPRFRKSNQPPRASALYSKFNSASPWKSTNASTARYSTKQVPVSANGNGIKLRSSVIISIVSILVLGTVILEGRFTTSSPAPFKNHRRHVSPIIVASTNAVSTTASSLVRTVRPTSPPVTPLPRGGDARDNPHSGRINETAPTRVTRRHLNERPEWLESYLTFHQQHVVPSSRRHRRGIDSTPQYRLMHGVENNTASLTYRCNGQSCGGIGDRLQGVVQTFFMAICSNRLFTIDWRESRVPPPMGASEGNAIPRQLSSYLQPRDLQWNIVDSNDEVGATSVVEPAIVHAMDHRNNTLLVAPDAILPMARNVILRTNLWMGDDFLHGTCWQSYRSRFAPSSESATDVVRWAFDALFQWSTLVQDAAASLRQRSQLSRPYVAMHIRTGLIHGDSSVPQRHADPTDWTRFVQCAHKVRLSLRERWCAKQSRDVNEWMDLYLASDHRSVKEALLVEDSSIKTVLDLTLHHVDTNKHQSDVSDDMDGSLAAWSELYMLQEAVCLVQSHSKYSAVAGQISGSRCAVYYDDCSDATVQLAVSSIPNNRVDGSRYVDCG